MTKNRIEKLLAHLKQVRDNQAEDAPGFNMCVYKRESLCGTISCLGGHTVFLFDPDLYARHNFQSLDWFEEARALLGLNTATAIKLFYVKSEGLWSEEPLRHLLDVTIHHAILALEQLLETGDIDWGLIFVKKGS